MRTFSRLLAVVVVTLGLTPALQGHAWACSCVLPQGNPTEAETYRAAAEGATVIYVGTVTEVRASGDDMDGRNHFTIAVSETLKGPAKRTREVTSARNGGLCGVMLKTGRKILVANDGRDTVGSCDAWTTQERVDQRAAIVRDALAAPVMPRTGADATAWVLFAGAALVVARRRRAA